MKGIGEYTNILTNVSCFLHPTSALFAAGESHEFVVYHEVMVTTKEYAQHATAVEPEWLAEVGGVLFSLAHTGPLKQTYGGRQKRPKHVS